MKISVIFGTRPEAIKLAPVVLALRNNEQFRCCVCVTAQHREMLDQVLNVFGIAPDVDLDLMRPGQTLTELTCQALTGVNAYLQQEKPDLVLVQGDTTTVFACALAAFYNHIPLGHVEAGLRTWNMESPWPEEGNRVLTTHLAAMHFVPTAVSRQNLLREGVPQERIFVTGNTVIDALQFMVAEVRKHPPEIPQLDSSLLNGRRSTPVVLITGHRRESFGTKLRNICRAIRELAERFPETQFIYPVHLNPNVRSGVAEVLGSAALHNVRLIEPLSYLPFVALMERATVILTDSGGIQEEAPSLGKPVLVTRDTTERPEALATGTVKLVGADAGLIIGEISRLLTDQSYYAAMSKAHSPYGDGKATARIMDAISAYFAVKTHSCAALP